MGRRRCAWLVGGTGKRVEAGKKLSGYTVEWRDDSHRHRRRTFGAQQAARQFLKGLNHRFDESAMGDLAPVTLERAVEEFLGGLGALSHSSQLMYAQTTALFREHAGPETLIGLVTVHHVENLLRQLRDEDKAESTIARQWGELRRFFRWCIKRRYRDSDPTQDVTVRPTTAVRLLPSLPTEGDVVRLVRSIDDHHLRIAVLIGLTTGLDRGIVAGLTGEHVDLSRRVIRVIRKKTARSRPTIIVAPVHRHLVDPLRALICESAAGQPMFQEYGSRRWWKAVQAKAGSPWDRLRVSDFRKIASSRMQTVLPLVQVQKILGHSTPETTARHYSQLDPASLRAIDKLPLPTIRTAQRKTRRRRA